MDFNSVLQAITTVGFPIVMCLILMWYINKTEERHKDETEKLTEALNNNTLAIQSLKDNILKEM